MSLPLIVETELDAVNFMLRVIGEQPVNSIDESQLSEAVLAQQVLHRVNRTTQTKGLRCNSDYEYELALTGGEVQLPANVLSIERVYDHLDVVERGRKLYDRENKTYTFDEPVKVDIVWFIAFDDLPEHVRNYVTVQAARRFASDTVGEADFTALTNEELLDVLNEFKRKELNNSNYSGTLLNGRGAFEIVNRRV